MEAQDREKLVARIRKLYAMGRENESSPHEAEIAMRRCQSLMDRFGISEADLETSEFGASTIGKTFRAVPGYVGVLGSAVALLHDCICVRSETIEFRGFSLDAEVASLTHAYLTDAMERSLKVHKRQGSVEPGRSASFDYRVGFAVAVLGRARIITEERKAAEAELVRSATVAGGAAGTGLVSRKQEMVREACMKGLSFGRRRSVRYRDGAAHRAGASDGSAVSLDRQINGGKAKAITG